ncbi:MAG: helix-turn-helix transcriptional regulator, partial [Alphaproteobacteria bacterium]
VYPRGNQRAGAGRPIAKAWGGARLALAAEEALMKIEAVLPRADRARIRDTALYAMQFSQSEDVARDLDFFDAAISDRTRVAMAYETLDGEKSRRTVRPLGLYYWGKVWTLVSWCELRDDFRTFRVDRICGPEALDKFHAEPGRSLSEYLKRMSR